MAWEACIMTSTVQNNTGRLDFSMNSFSFSPTSSTLSPPPLLTKVTLIKPLERSFGLHLIDSALAQCKIYYFKWVLVCQWWCQWPLGLLGLQTCCIEQVSVSRVVTGIWEHCCFHSELQIANIFMQESSGMTDFTSASCVYLKANERVNKNSGH